MPKRKGKRKEDRWEETQAKKVVELEKMVADLRKELKEMADAYKRVVEDAKTQRREVQESGAGPRPALVLGEEVDEEDFETVTTKRKKKQAGKQQQALAKTEGERDELLQEGWSVRAVGKTAAELKLGDGGVVLCSTPAEAKNVVRELVGTSAPAAVLSPVSLGGPRAQEEKVVQVPVKDETGVERLRRRHLVQVGPAGQTVSFKTEAPRVNLVNDTKVVVVRVESRDAQTAVWEKFAVAPQAETKKWLGEKEVDVLDTVGRTQWLGNGVLQVAVRVNSSHVEKALQSSGQAGVFVRPFWTAAEDTKLYKPVWLDAGTDLETALGKAKRCSGALGVVRSKDSLAVRVKAEVYVGAVRELAGQEAAEDAEKTVWELAGLPPWCGKPSLRAALREWGWADAEPSKPLQTNAGRLWLVKAKTEPPGGWFSVGDGQVVRVRKAETKLEVKTRKKAQETRPPRSTWNWPPLPGQRTQQGKPKEEQARTPDVVMQPANAVPPPQPSEAPPWFLQAMAPMMNKLQAMESFLEDHMLFGVEKEEDGDGTSFAPRRSEAARASPY